MTVRVVLPAHLRTLSRIDGEAKVDVAGPVTQRAVLDALEAMFPVLRGTIRDQMTHARSATIPAPPAAVFAQINDLHMWEAWSPWEKIDPAMKKTFDGPPAGAGASFAWTGNSSVGEGRVTITDMKSAATKS